MASLDYLREEMASALAVMEDTSKPSETRRAARARFWHCEKRVGTMERGGRTEDDPGHILLGYSELGYSRAPKTSPAPLADHRRSLIDQRTEAHFKAKETL